VSSIPDPGSCTDGAQSSGYLAAITWVSSRWTGLISLENTTGLGREERVPIDRDHLA
jgi:hypothetical protein